MQTRPTNEPGALGPPDSEILAKNIGRVRVRMEEARERCGRRAPGPELLAVTKKVSEETILNLHALGLREFGENRADELERKATVFRERGLDARWHFIGTLQKNKVRRVVRFAQVIHSIDSAELLQRVERIAGEEERSLELYLELKTSHENEKHGMVAEEIRELCRVWTPREACRLVGMMTMAPRPTESQETSMEAAQTSFNTCATLARDLEADPATAQAFDAERCRLSMGMSGDLELAIAAGSDLVRVGSALFERGAA